MKLGLGTVQFGLNYGIKADGKPSFEEAGRILARAAGMGIDVLDTAPAYGDSETVIGRALPASHGFRIVTKTAVDQRNDLHADARGVGPGLEASLKRLDRPNVYGLLLHHGEKLLETGGEILWRAMEKVRERGLAQKIGVSVYSGPALGRLLTRFEPDIVQAPLNIFDQRLIENGMLDEMKSRGVEFHARSVFLQGLLLMPIAELPPYFRRFAPHFQRFHGAVASAGLSPLSAALGFVAAVSAVDVLIAGVNSVAHLEEIAAALHAPTTLPEAAALAVDDTALIDPTTWPKTS